MSSGYLLATRYEELYRQAIESHHYDETPHNRPVYGVPWKENLTPPPDAPHYRGIDRDPLRPLPFELADMSNWWGFVATPATNALDEIEERTGREDGWVTSVSDVMAVWDLLAEDRSKYEVIFGREYGDMSPVPDYCYFLGCDAAHFVSDYFSCICDALFFPRWHGTDPEGVLFAEHYARLNRHGLFDTHDSALAYLKYYLSFDWTERSDDFTSIEVYAVDLEKASSTMSR